jgi:hypothetical protein
VGVEQLTKRGLPLEHGQVDASARKSRLNLRGVLEVGGAPETVPDAALEVGPEVEVRQAARLPHHLAVQAQACLAGTHFDFDVIFFYSLL